MQNKKIIIHIPAFLDDHILSERIQRYYERLADSFEALGLDFVNHHIPKDKELRRNDSFNHIVYNTRNKLDNWMHVQIAYLNDFLYLDPEGYWGWSSIRRAKFSASTVDIDDARAYLRDIRTRFVDPQITKYGSLGTKDVSDIPDGSIGIFLQSHDKDDEKLAYVDPADMIRATIRNRDNRPIVIKRHPNCHNRKYKTLIEEALEWAPNIYQTRANTHAMMPKLDTVVSINSAASVEALFHDKHVITMGRCDFHHATASLDKGEEIDSVFDKKRHRPQYIKKYLYWLFATQLLDIQSDNFTKRVEEQLQKQGWV